MAHFAQLDSDNVVTQVIVVSDSDTSDINGVELESIGVAFCQQLFGAETVWKQTSITNSMRFRYATIGGSYNAELDAFITRQPFSSWTLNNSTADWDPPITKPTLTDEQRAAGSFYRWNEDAYQADNTTGWVLKEM